ncbi:hypothetical protein RB595_004715 [Gaeumannomyces hyphopodioides]
MVNKWALLIGVDVYDPPKAGTKKDTRGKDIEYETLHGAVLDVMEVKEHLTKHMGVKECRIKMYLTPSWDDESEYTSNSLPVYDNIKEGMQWVLDKTDRGDLVYFHYSGHGAQATTVYEALKGRKGLDEALVPMDANNGGRYLRDIEMALWLKKVVAKPLNATIVLDCCHSGSAARGAGRVRFRGIPQTYESVDADRPSPEFLNELRAHGIGRQGEDDAVVHGASMLRDGWLVEPRGYALLAACQPRQSAREFEDDDFVSHGALTYWLLDTLRRDPGAARSTRNLYRRVSAQIQSYYSDQLPLIGGATDRAFFGTDDIAPVNFIRVADMSRSRGKILGLTLDGGRLHGVRIGAKYGIYSSTDEAGSADVGGEMLAEVEITEVDPQSSKARLDVPVKEGEIEPGCKAALLSIPPSFQCSIGFSDSVGDDVEKMFHSAWDVVPARHRARIRILPRTEHNPVTFIVSVNEAGKFEILDRDGVGIPNLEPPLRPLPARKPSSPGSSKKPPATGDPSFVKRVIYRLEHLASYNMVKTLQNPNETSEMRRAFEVVVSGKADNKDRISRTPVEERNAAFEVKHKEYLIIRVTNSSKAKELHFAVLDLQPLYGIEQVYPVGADMQLVDSGQTIEFSLEMTVPDNFDGNDCVDTFKLIATPTPTSLAALELHDLCDAESKRRGSDPLNPLQEMLDTLKFGLRNGRCKPVDEWAVEAINVRTSRDAPT